MQNKSPTNDEPIKVFDVDDIRIDYNPSIDTPRGKTKKSISIDFHILDGWYRFRLEDTVCDLFNQYYNEQVVSRYE